MSSGKGELDQLAEVVLYGVLTGRLSGVPEEDGARYAALVDELKEKTDDGRDG